MAEDGWSAGMGALVVEGGCSRLRQGGALKRFNGLIPSGQGGEASAGGVPTATAGGMPGRPGELEGRSKPF